MLTVFHTKKFLKDYCIRHFRWAILTSFPRKKLEIAHNMRKLYKVKCVANLFSVHTLPITELQSYM